MKDLIGKEVRIIANVSGHGYKIGEKVRVINRARGNRGGEAMFICRNKIDLQYDVYKSDMQTDQTKEELKKELKDLEDKLEMLRNKITYMNDTKCKLFDDTKFKVHQIVKELSTGEHSMEEKVNKVTELVG